MAVLALGAASAAGGETREHAMESQAPMVAKARAQRAVAMVRGRTAKLIAAACRYTSWRRVGVGSAVVLGRVS